MSRLLLLALLAGCAAPSRSPDSVWVGSVVDFEQSFRAPEDRPKFGGMTVHLSDRSVPALLRRADGTIAEPSEHEAYWIWQVSFWWRPFEPGDDVPREGIDAFASFASRRTTLEGAYVRTDLPAGTYTLEYGTPPRTLDIEVHPSTHTLVRINGHGPDYEPLLAEAAGD